MYHLVLSLDPWKRSGKGWTETWPMCFCGRCIKQGVAQSGGDQPSCNRFQPAHQYSKNVPLLQSAGAKRAEMNEKSRRAENEKKMKPSGMTWPITSGVLDVVTQKTSHGNPSNTFHPPPMWANLTMIPHDWGKMKVCADWG